jgi:hypothetical protein
MNKLQENLTIYKLQENLTIYNRKYPDIWKVADGLRKSACENLNFWNWSVSYLPLIFWKVLVTKYNHFEKCETLKKYQETIGKDELIDEWFLDVLNLEEFKDVIVLSALAGWRYTQDVYVFDKILYEALITTELKDSFPVEILLRLPCWTIYVKIDDSIFDKILNGFYIHINDILDVSEIRVFKLIIVLDSISLVPIEIVINPTLTYTLDDFIIHSSIDHLKISSEEYLENKSLINSILSLLLYLLSAEPDITSHIPQPKPTYPTYIKTKKGNKLFPPDKPRIWNVGKIVGDSIRQIQSNEKKSIEHKTKRPHIRRAHWHGFWSGKRDSEQKFNYKWLPPIIVGIEE